MARTTYSGTLEINFEIEIDNSVIDRTQEEEWQSVFYKLSRKQAIGMISRNFLKGNDLDSLDGFCDMDNGNVKLVYNNGGWIGDIRIKKIKDGNIVWEEMEDE